MAHPLLNNYPAFREIAKQFHVPILMATLIMAIASMLALAVPFALKNLVEQYSANGAVLYWVLAGITLLITSLGLQALGSLRSTMVAERLKTHLRLHLYRLLLGKNMAFHREHGPGDQMSALYSDVDQLSSLYSNLLPSGVSSALILVGASIALGRLDPALATVLLVSAFVAFLMLRLAFRRIRKMGKQLHERFSAMYKAVNETLRQVMVIKTYRLTEWAEKRLEAEQDEVVKLNVKLRFYYGVMSIVVQLLLAIALVMGWVLLTRSTSPDDLGIQLSSLLYGLLLVRQVGNAANLFAQYRQAQGAMDRLSDLLGGRFEMPVAREDGTDSAPQTLLSLEIRDLNFDYGDRKVLDRVRVSVKAGDKIALVGANGAGKTTLLNILVGLEKAPPGTVFWNKDDLSGFNPDELRKHVAYLPQDSLLNQASIADNLRMGNLDASDEELWNAAEQAGISNTIRQLENVMDTVLGAEGSRLSGGEKRRLSLARLLVRQDADLYLLDEPTEGLDPEGEQQILTTALEALDGKTVILITHRPAALDRVDRVWTMENGRLTEST